MKPHKHAEVIKAWADGAEIEYLEEMTSKEPYWSNAPMPKWSLETQYRVKPKTNPDVVFSTHIQWDIGWKWVNTTSTKKHNLKMIFDAETGELKSAEVCK